MKWIPFFGVIPLILKASDNVLTKKEIIIAVYQGMWLSVGLTIAIVVMVRL
jgi:hypothetical protein